MRPGAFVGDESFQRVVDIGKTFEEVVCTRSTEQKKALYRRAVELLGENPGIRPQDLFINVLEARKENWSLGDGVASFMQESETADRHAPSPT